MKNKFTSHKKIYESKPADVKGSIANESAEDRLSKLGFFLNGDLQGTNEGEQLAATLADIIKSMKEISPDTG